MQDYAGTWTGEIAGTNQADILIQIQQQGSAVTGIARINDIRFGPSVYSLVGTAGDQLVVQLSPKRALPGIVLGQVSVVASLQEPDKSLRGKWESTIGTAGAFVARRDTAIGKACTRRVFVVHGHDGELKQAVARFLERLGLEPVILHEQPNLGRTLIEKFEKNADADYAVVLLTPDDIGYPANQEEQAKPRARQNVILELGYFVGRIGRGKVCALHRGDVEIPSDLHGVVYVPVDPAEGWKLKLGAELKHSGMDIDLNRLL